MKQTIVVNATTHQTRIALLEEDELCELYVEGKSTQRVLGNVYKGVVTKVLPGMQAAFVNIGLERDAFLYVMDVFDNTEEFARMLDRENGEGELPASSTPPEEDSEVEPVLAASIEELLREGQHVLVQVSREPIGNKGARVTSHITLPGRYLVYMPTVDHIGVSKKIEDEETRARLRRLLHDLRPGQGGYIVRTVGENTSSEDFKSDMEMLILLWRSIQAKAEKAAAPSLIHRDLDPIFRTIRDLLTPQVDRLIIDSESDYERCIEYLDTVSPHLTSRVKLFTKERPIFEEFRIEEQIERALRQRVWLKSGGYIVIDQTEALVAIDVNTGKYVGKRNLEETITRTNLQAAKVIARQIRLRDLGGIIIIDFIDMEQEENRRLVLKELETELKKDRSRVSVSPFTHLGLVQLTRKRLRRSIQRTLCQPCPYCKGVGVIKSGETITYRIYLELKKLCLSAPEREFLLRVNPAIASRLRYEDRDLIHDIERSYHKTITIHADDVLHHEQFDIIPM